MPPCVTATNLRLAHGDHLAVDTSSFSLPSAATIAVIGPNGSGKSTLFDAIAGLVKPAAGSIELSPEVSQRHGIAYVLQSLDTPRYLPMTVREVVTMGRYQRTGLLGSLGSEGRQAIEEAMRRTAVTELADRHLGELSGGQRQRVLVAQGLAARASLLILDEPMTGLDLVSQRQVDTVIEEETAAGHTVIFSTHELGEAAAADVVMLMAGRVVAVGTPEEVLTEANLREAYQSQLLDFNGLTVLDDPHHHGEREDRHDGHEH